MRAASGAISHVAARDGRLKCRVIGDCAPRGICGSGVVDAVATGLSIEAIQTNGRLTGGTREFTLLSPVSITQADIRELQLAKGAIAAGLRLLLERCHAGAGGLSKVYLAGAFGNYIDIESGRRIGLLEADRSSIVPAGNTALRGVKMTLLAPRFAERRLREILRLVQHVPLAADPRFQETFVDCLAFPSITGRESGGATESGVVKA
jgi:uncharacterized 2Fe-2S/4Fe-4S cluster protein (DUF4445 family)